MLINCLHERTAAVARSMRKRPVMIMPLVALEMYVKHHTIDVFDNINVVLLCSAARSLDSVARVPVIVSGPDAIVGFPTRKATNLYLACRLSTRDVEPKLKNVVISYLVYAGLMRRRVPKLECARALKIITLHLLTPV